ncbi:MAG TPA: GTP cyclohydrolase I FolE, partial [Halieaceae bacterium]|nr:GTP cyclohydrolase I FolE [Halieaceae bacterium]
METALAGNIPYPSKMSAEAAMVREALLERGLETPMIQNGLTRDEKYRRIVQSFTEITRTLGLDLNDDSLAETP